MNGISPFKPAKGAHPEASPVLGTLPREAKPPGPAHPFVPKPRDGDPVELTARQAEAEAEARTREDARRLAQREEELQALKARFSAGIAEISAAAERAQRVLARDAVAVGMLVAEGLLGRALAVDVKAIAELVRGALREVPEEAGTKVRVSPDDLPRVELVLAGTKRPSIELVADPKLGPGDCVVESPSLIVDARLRDRLGAIGTALEESIAPSTVLPTHDEVSIDDVSHSLDNTAGTEHDTSMARGHELEGFGGGTVEPDAPHDAGLSAPEEAPPATSPGPAGPGPAALAQEPGPDSISLDEPAPKDR